VRQRKAGAIQPVNVPTFHAIYGVLLTPALAKPPPKARHLPAEAVRGLRGANVVVETPSGTYIVGTKSSLGECEKVGPAGGKQNCGELPRCRAHHRATAPPRG
jgi:hypothetical protein